MAEEAHESIFNRVSKQNFHITSNNEFNKQLTNLNNIADNHRDYINGFSKVAKDIIDHFVFEAKLISWIKATYYT